jgi:hypothetical protein
MELQERINVLIQGVELDQKAGVLSLDEAYYAKQAIDALKKGVSLKEAFEVLIQVITIGQKKGVYTLRDSYLLYLAIDNYESAITPPAPQVQQPIQQLVQQPTPQTEVKKPRKKES